MLLILTLGQVKEQKSEENCRIIKGGGGIKAPETHDNEITENIFQMMSKIKTKQTKIMALNKEQPPKDQLSFQIFRICNMV